MDVLPQVCLFRHSFVKRLAGYEERRGELLGQELGLAQVMVSLTCHLVGSWTILACT